MVSQSIYIEVKKQNKKTLNDEEIVDIPRILQEEFKFVITDRIENLLVQMKQALMDYVRGNNKYVDVKIQEELSKAKQPKREQV